MTIFIESAWAGYSAVFDFDYTYQLQVTTDIEDAAVSFADSGTAPETVTSDQNGEWTQTINPTTYQINAEKFGYIIEPYSLEDNRFAGTVKISAIPAEDGKKKLYPSVDGFVLNKSGINQGTGGTEDGTVTATVQTSNAED